MQTPHFHDLVAAAAAMMMMKGSDCIVIVRESMIH